MKTPHIQASLNPTRASSPIERFRSELDRLLLEALSVPAPEEGDLDRLLGHASRLQGKERGKAAYQIMATAISQARDQARLEYQETIARLLYEGAQKHNLHLAIPGTPAKRPEVLLINEALLDQVRQYFKQDDEKTRTRRELGAQFNLSEKQSKRLIRQLIKDGSITREGTGR